MVGFRIIRAQRSLPFRCPRPRCSIQPAQSTCPGNGAVRRRGNDGPILGPVLGGWLTDSLTGAVPQNIPVGSWRADPASCQTTSRSPLDLFGFALWAWCWLAAVDARPRPA
jgi:hypothetical protein